MTSGDSDPLAEGQGSLDDGAEHPSPRYSDDSPDSEDELFVYPSTPSNPEDGPQQSASARQIHPTPAQLESLYAAACSGDLSSLKKVFHTALENSDIEPFNLSNDAAPRTGFTALHAAASRGYYDMTVWRKSFSLSPLKLRS